METVGRIICYGSSPAPARDWHCKKHVGINRLYYIHSGVGGYRHKGREYPLISGKLYYIPYTADFIPFCEEADPIYHTYIDFELVPPIITDSVVCLDADKSETVSAATRIFIAGGEANKNDARSLAAFLGDQAFFEVCKASIVYLVNRVVTENGIRKIEDGIVIKALEMMHTRMGEKLSVRDMAKDCYMSTDSFIRHFSHVVGVTPHAYLKNIRLITARYLRESGAPLTQIAREVGYADATSLSHALKEG